MILPYYYITILAQISALDDAPPDTALTRLADRNRSAGFKPEKGDGPLFPEIRTVPLLLGPSPFYGQG